MSTSHLILGILISNNRGRRRRQDRPKSRSEKPKTLHVHNAFSYISLPSRHDCGVKLRGRELFTWHRNHFHSRASSCHLHIYFFASVHMIPRRNFVPVQAILEWVHSGFHSGMKLTLESYKQPLNFTFYGGRAHKTTIFFFFIST